MSKGKANEHAVSSIQIHAKAKVNQLISHANDSHNSKSACTSSVFGVILGSWPGWRAGAIARVLIVITL